MQLARAVADTVVIPTPGSQNGSVAAAQATDERFFGCFSQGSSTPYVSSEFSLCLHRDGTFRWQSSMRVASGDSYAQEQTSAGYGDVDETGKWS